MAATACVRRALHLGAFALILTAHTVAAAQSTPADRLQKDVQAVARKVEALERQLAINSQSLTSVAARNTDAELVRRISAAEARVQTLQNLEQLIASHDAELRALQAATHAAASGGDLSLGRIGQLDERIQALQQSLAAVESRIAGLRATDDKLASHDAAIQSMRAKLADSELSVSGLKVGLETLQGSAIDLARKQTDSDRRTAELIEAGKTAAAQAIAEADQRALQALEQVQKSLDRRMTSRDTEVQAALAHGSDATAAIGQRLTGTQENLDSLRDLQKRQTAEIIDAMSVLDTWRQVARAQIDQQSQALARTQSDLDRLGQSVAALTADKTVLQEQNAWLKAELSTQTKRLNALMASQPDVGAMNRQIAELTDAVQRLMARPQVTLPSAPAVNPAPDQRRESVISYPTTAPLSFTIDLMVEGRDAHYKAIKSLTDAGVNCIVEQTPQGSRISIEGLPSRQAAYSRIQWIRQKTGLTFQLR